MAAKEWARSAEAHADAGADVLNGTKAGLFSKTARFVALPAGAWEKVKAAEVREVLAKAARPAAGKNAVAEAALDTLPAAYAFETKEGAAGVVEIVSFTPAEVRIRYKQAAAVAGATQGAAAPDARQTAERYVAAALGGKAKEAAGLADGQKAAGRVDGTIRDLATLKIEKLAVKRVVAAGDVACAMTEDVAADHGRKGPLVVTMTRMAGVWKVVDVDLDAGEGEGTFGRFVREHPEGVEVGK
jgi:hypothetical protein